MTPARKQSLRRAARAHEREKPAGDSRLVLERRRKLHEQRPQPLPKPAGLIQKFPEGRPRAAQARIVRNLTWKLYGESEGTRRLGRPLTVNLATMWSIKKELLISTHGSTRAYRERCVPSRGNAGACERGMDRPGSADPDHGRPRQVTAPGPTELAEHRLACHRHRRPAERQESVVELAPGLAAAARRGPVFAKLANHQLAKRVVEVARVVGAARGLLARVARILERLFAGTCARIPRLSCRAYAFRLRTGNGRCDTAPC